MQHADAIMLIRRLERALAEHRRDRRSTEAWDMAQIEDYRTMFDRVWPEAQMVMRRVVFDYNATIQLPTRVTADVVRAAERAFNDLLDLRPPSKSALAVFRPLWPMSIDQLSAQVDAWNAEGNKPTRTNPAPLFRKDKLPRYEQDRLAFSAHRAVYWAKDPVLDAFRLSELPESDWDTLDGMAWGLAMPEGFPPYPRRGGVYSKHEASAVNRWLREEWPVTRVIYALARQRDGEITRAGIDPSSVQRILQNTLTGWVTSYTYAYPRPKSRYGFPSAEGLSPKELHAEILAWAESYGLPTYRALMEITPGLLQRQADPDEHIQQIESNYLTAGSIAAVAEEVYGLARYSSGGWLEKLTGDQHARRPSDYIARSREGAGPSKRDRPLSVLLDAQAKADAAYAARRKAEQAAAERDAAVAREALRGLRTFSRANIQAALPGWTLDVRDTYRPVSVHLRSPEVQVAYGSGPNLTAALADMREKLGL